MALGRIRYRAHETLLVEVILTLSLEQFGLIALASSLFSCLSVFQGLGQALIHFEGLDDLVWYRLLDDELPRTAVRFSAQTTRDRVVTRLRARHDEEVLLEVSGLILHLIVDPNVGPHHALP